MYVAALLSNPEFFNHLSAKESFYTPGVLSTKIAKAVADLEAAFENPIHNVSGPKEDESNNLGP